MSKKLEDKLNSRMREFRARHRITQADLANKVGVSRQTIVAIEKGDYNPSVALALRIASVFKASLEQVFWLSK